MATRLEVLAAIAEDRDNRPTAAEGGGARPATFSSPLGVSVRSTAAARAAAAALALFFSALALGELEEAFAARGEGTPRKRRTEPCWRPACATVLSPLKCRTCSGSSCSKTCFQKEAGWGGGMGDGRMDKQKTGRIFP